MDIQLHYIEEGQGFPLILLHGNGEDSSHFKHQIDYFSKEYRVIALDTRGQGKSPRGTASFTFEQFAEDLRVFMDTHGIFKANILGFSDGGIIALVFALKNPERVNRLVLNGVNLDPSGVVEPVRKCIHEKALQAAEHKDEGADAMERYERLTLMDRQPVIDPKELAKLDDIPALVIVGTNDLIEAEHTQLIYRSLPNSELVFIAGDHFIAYENPADFNKAVDDFLHEV